jgi:adenylosuccinate lyase
LFNGPTLHSFDIKVKHEQVFVALVIALVRAARYTKQIMGVEEQLLAVTPIDGRYADKVEALTPIASEFGLIQRRVAVEAAWLGHLGNGTLPDVPAFSDGAADTLIASVDGFSVSDAAEIKAIEKETNHDVKAVEIWLRRRFADHPELSERLELIHFSATSEDINNLAYAMMIRDAREDVIEPGIRAVRDDLGEKTDQYAMIPMLGRTHGQPATPTTLGKEMAVFGERLDRSLERLGAIAAYGKFNGATGSYNAAAIAYPEVDWPEVNKRFVRDLGFQTHQATTQIEPHDWIAAFCNELGLNNRIMTDLSQDIWFYISQGYFKQRTKAGEVGSSTMPHKVNPIDFENAEANFGASGALLKYLAEKLPVSRLQRDLSDSSALRTLGEAFGHTAVAHASVRKGLGKIYPDEARMDRDLDENWAILTEAVQTVARRYGVKNPYDKMKAASRGVAFDKGTYLGLVEELDIPDEAKQRLRELRPSTYLGYAREIAGGDIS